MMIYDLEYLQVICEESRIEGGFSSVVGAVASAGAIGTNQSFIFNSANTSNSIIESSSPFFTPFAVSISSSIATAFAF